MAVRRVLLVLALSVSTIPAVPQVATAQTGPTLEVGMGVGGFTPSDRPGEMAVTLSSPILIAGRVRVRGGDIALSRPVEVPAGSSQTYRLTLPPLVDGTRLTVEVVDGDGDTVVSETVTARAPSGEEVTVGVMGADELVDALGRVRTVVTDRPVAAFAVAGDMSPAGMAVLDYVVVGREGSAGVDTALGWARSGGSVVLDSSLREAIDMEGAVASEPAGVTRGRLGDGDVVVVEDLAGRDASEWASILRPPPLDIGRSPEWGMTDPRSLLQAASEAGSRQIPSIPWLLFAILGFTLVVGPVNFLVLSRLGKRDWAWVTIPSLALLAVVGFWVAGRQRIAGTNLTHATFIAREGSTEARSAVMVAAGTAGERRLSFDEGSEAFPERSLTGGPGTELQFLGEGAVAVELEQLGFTGLGLYSPGPAVDLPRVSVEGDRLVVENAGELSFWGWGAMSAGAASVSDAELAAGANGEVAVPQGAGREFGFGFIDALVNERQLWEDPARNNSLWPLSQLLFSEAEDGSVYFVGLTDDYRPQVSVDGASEEIAGPTLVMVQAEEAAAARDRAEATVVDTGFINWVDWGAQRVISTDEMTIRFRLPDPSLEARLADARRFGNAPAEYLAWDWERGEFRAIEMGEPLPAPAVATDGVVYVRLVGANELGDNPMSPRDLTLEWEA
ncbi:MAG: hypothetical protein ACLFWM_10550 [Actinomycetota bacterium]